MHELGSVAERHPDDTDLVGSNITSCGRRLATSSGHLWLLLSASQPDFCTGHAFNWTEVRKLGK